MPEIRNRIEIAAPPGAVYQVARDVERFPDFMPEVKSIRVAERSEDGSRTVVEWVGFIPRFQLTVKWTEEDLWDDAARTCRFTQVKGDFDRYDGEWRFEPEGEGTVFESVVRYEITVPLVGALIQGVIRKTMHENVQRLLEAVRRRVESGEAAG
jgi:ribosome-associated toxin RatA of RatAB toxin-antitoxin module